MQFSDGKRIDHNQFGQIETSELLPKVIGMRISFVRNALLRLKQDRFGYMVGVSKCTVSRWEAGMRVPNAIHLYKIAFLSKKALSYFFEE